MRGGRTVQDLGGTVVAYAFERIEIEAGITTQLTGTLVEPDDQTGPSAIRISVENSSIRYRCDGIAEPDADNGHLLRDGDTADILGWGNLVKMRMFAPNDDAVVQVTYYR